jgi:hypothetical protein
MKTDAFTCSHTKYICTSIVKIIYLRSTVVFAIRIGEAD